jgi:MFS family permease
MFVVSRILLGLGIPFAINGASQLIAELTHPRERGVITGLFNESWYAGAIIAAGVTLGTFSMKSNWSWRLPSLLQMLPSSLQLIFIWCGGVSLLPDTLPSGILTSQVRPRIPPLARLAGPQ